MLAMKILGLRHGTKTPFDNQYLKEYDTERDGVLPDGLPILAHIVTTPHLEEAMKFSSLLDLHKTWTKRSERLPINPDGTENRPLSAFNIEFVRC